MAQYFDFMLRGARAGGAAVLGRAVLRREVARGSPRSSRAKAPPGRSAGCAEGEVFADSHVNLIPTRSGGTHEAGFRNGIFDALAAFMDTRALAPKGVKLIADDLWQRACFTLSARIVRTQFHGQTKEKLTTRHAAKLLELCVRDAFELWLNQHADEGKKIVELAIEQAHGAPRQGQEVRAEEVERRRHAARQAGRLRLGRHHAQRIVHGRGRFGGRLGQGSARQGDAGDAAAARQGAEHHVEGQRARCSPTRSCRRSPPPSASTRTAPEDSPDLLGPALRQGHHHDRRRRGRRPHPGAAAHLLLHARAASWSRSGRIYVAQPPLFKVEVPVAGQGQARAARLLPGRRRAGRRRSAR